MMLFLIGLTVFLLAEFIGMLILDKEIKLVLKDVSLGKTVVIIILMITAVAGLAMILIGLS